MGNARSRIEGLLDARSFVEIGAEITARSTDFNMASKKAASDGVITGYGVIDGYPVFVYSQDASVLNGTVGEMHSAKIVRLYEMAVKTGAPVIGLVDCAGMRLEEGTDALNAFGQIYKAQCDASGVIPQITAVFGGCGGAMAISAAMSDFTFMQADKACMFVNTPNAIEGNHVSKCDCSSAAFQSEETENVDMVGTEEEIVAAVRELVAMLPANNEDDSYGDSADDPNRACSNLEALALDPYQMLVEIADDHRVFEACRGYAKEMVTALISLNGATVGVVANRSVRYAEDGTVAEEFENALSAKGAKKAADFVNFCDAFSIPIVSFVNVKSIKAKMCTERNIAKAAAKLVFAFSNATSPKISVITGEAFGSAYLIMNSKAVGGADMVYAWDSARVGMMDAKSAAKIICEGESAEAINEAAAKYDELQNSAQAAAKRGFVDSIIDPSETRKYLIGAIELLFSKRDFRPEKKHGTV